MLAWSVAMLTVILLACGWLAWHPTGAVERCRQAVEAARVSPIAGER